MCQECCECVRGGGCEAAVGFDRQRVGGSKAQLGVGGAGVCGGTGGSWCERTGDPWRRSGRFDRTLTSREPVAGPTRVWISFSSDLDSSDLLSPDQNPG